MGEFTQLMNQLRSGRDDAEEQLWALVYGELRAMAEHRLRNERADHTLSPTALVHETYLRLVDDQQRLRSRSEFLAAAAVTLQRVLIDHARRRRREKRGGGEPAVRLDPGDAIAAPASQDLVALSNVIERLAEIDRRKACIAVMRLLAFRHREIAEALNLSTPTIRREWRAARAWIVAAFDA